MNKILRVSFSVLMLLVIFPTAFPASPAAAAGFIEVNSSADTTADDGSCTLREAITAANLKTASGGTAGECAAGTGVDEITFTGNFTITLNGQFPPVTDELTITGNGAANTIVQADAAPFTATHRVFEVSGSGTLTINHLSILNGYVDASGGAGILNFGTLAVANSTLSNNAAYSGAGITNLGTLTVTNSTFSNNAAIWGGGIDNQGTISSITDSTFSGNEASDEIDSGGGAGILNRNSHTITSITGTTFSENSVINGDGGGIYNYGTITTIGNSTFAGNSNIGWGGSGIINSASGTIATIANSTFSGNSSSGLGSSAINNTGTITTIANTIVANSPGGNCYGNAPGGTSTNNLTDSSGCVWSWTNTLDPANHLGTLADNGGPTETIALVLVPGSPAIDAGDNTTCAAAAVNNFDQRGKPRPADSDLNGSAICDIGAFEYQHTIVTKTLRSQYRYDGWVLESGEFTKKGGSRNPTGKILKVGDDDYDRQYRAILSFGTAALEDTAIITKVILKVKKQGVVGTNPMKTHNGLVVDVKLNKFSTRPALQVKDFQATANKYKVGKFRNRLYSGWYRSVLYKGAYAYINKKGHTQFRLRFLRDDNDDNSADILMLYSGNSIFANRPQLIVSYYVP